VSSKLCPKIILEGTRLTFKTESAFALNEHPLQVFIDEQDLFRRLIGESILSTLELDISDGDVVGAADRIADWMTETGGLWAK